MAGNLFDVFVVGSADPTAAGETRLATALSTKHGVPLAVITKAISAKNLRAGQGLEQAVAQTLVRQLQGMGAVTVIHPSNATSQGQGSPSPPKTPLTNSTTVPPDAASGGLGSLLLPLGTPNPGAGAFGPPLGMMPSTSPSLTANTFASPRKGTTSPAGANPFEPPRSITPVIGITERPVGTPRPANQAKSSREQILTDIASGPRLELARGDRATSADELSGMRRLPTNATGTNLRDLGLAGKSGVETDRDPKNINLIRCIQHGLYYDKTKASGCRKCLSAAREMAGHLHKGASEERIGGELAKQPAKWAFLGLAFALFIGLLPAAYYSFGPGTAQAKQSRVEQEILSRQPGSSEILHRFDELEKQISDSRSRNLRNTGIIWFAVTGIAMVGWFKLR